MPGRENTSEIEKQVHCYIVKCILFFSPVKYSYKYAAKNYLLGWCMMLLHPLALALMKMAMHLSFLIVLLLTNL